MNEKPAHVDIFTDGACSGNPGPGGWAAILRFGDQEKELSGAQAVTTNNRMEMMGALEGLRALKRPCRVVVHTDSQYVQKGMTEWWPKWKERGFKDKHGKPRANMDLWQALQEQAARHDVTWRWVRGHDGHAENERADALARAAIKTLSGC